MSRSDATSPATNKTEMSSLLPRPAALPALIDGMSLTHCRLGLKSACKSEMAKTLDAARNQLPCKASTKNTRHSRMSGLTGRVRRPK